MFSAAGPTEMKLRADPDLCWNGGVVLCVFCCCSYKFGKRTGRHLSEGLECEEVAGLCLIGLFFEFRFKSLREWWCASITYLFLPSDFQAGL